MTDTKDERAVEAVALAIGLAIWKSPVEPKGNWLRAAEAAIAAHLKALKAEGWKLEPPPTVFGHTSMARWNRENPLPIPPKLAHRDGQ